MNEVVALIGALGGFKLVEWGVTFLVNRRTNARKEDASADSLEDENERKQVGWLENRLAQRDQKIDALYVELRREQEAKLEVIHKLHESELRRQEAEMKRCEVRGCGKRQPPSDY